MFFYISGGTHIKLHGIPKKLKIHHDESGSVAVSHGDGIAILKFSGVKTDHYDHCKETKPVPYFLFLNIFL